MQLAELDDLDVLQQLVVAVPAVGAQQHGVVKPGAAPGPGDDDGVAQDDPDHLLQLAALVQVAPRRSQEHRPWQFCGTARSSKAKKAAEVKLEADRKRARHAQTKLALVASLYTSIGNALGCMATSVVST